MRLLRRLLMMDMLNALRAEGETEGMLLWRWLLLLLLLEVRLLAGRSNAEQLSEWEEEGHRSMRLLLLLLCWRRRSRRRCCC
jgi:hypothetical protein